MFKMLAVTEVNNVGPAMSQIDALAKSLNDKMTVFMPGIGPVSVAHVFRENGQVSFTNMVHDTEVDFPVATFFDEDSVSILVGEY